MKLKIATYNISGGFYEDDESVDFLDKKQAVSIDNRLLNDIVKNINDEDIDIICFQEIITTDEIKYIDMIVENTDLKYREHFELSPNHLIEGTDSGIAILSKYPIIDFKKNLFTNPKLSKTTSSGNTYYIFDKGYLMVTVDVNNTPVKVMTHHGFPFRRFNSTPEENKNVFYEFDNIIKVLNPDIIASDFNAENFINMMEYADNNYKKIIDEVTTVVELKFDNILISKQTNFTSKIINSLSDHFIVIVEVKF